MTSKTVIKGGGGDKGARRVRSKYTVNSACRVWGKNIIFGRMGGMFFNQNIDSSRNSK
jgi:hypothetical protein